MKLVRLSLFIVFITLISSVTAQNVFVTKTGEKYHKKTCRYLKYSKKEIKLKEAIEKAYEACLVCKPEKVIKKVTINGNVPSRGKTITPRKKPSTSSKKSSASQCTGRTKSGSRCKRRTKSTSGKCYQH